jgi:5-methyltetrahydrofolate--homocysteine methyltransferase
VTNTLDSIKEKCIKGKRVDVMDEVKRALAEGIEAKQVMLEALIPAMAVVGEKYSSGEYFLPQMMLGARAMSEALQMLKPYLAKGTYERKGKAVVGTVQGDFHDIGKNIVKIMLEGGGYEVVDLGVDVSPDAFVEAVRKEAPQFVLMSALITLTMDSMRKTIQTMEAAGVRNLVRIGIGGAPVTQKFADEIGADFYSSDAYTCVENCNQLLR